MVTAWEDHQAGGGGGGDTIVLLSHPIRSITGRIYLFQEFNKAAAPYVKVEI